MSAPWPTLSAAPNVDRPPWDWNPTETFLTAYNNVQENQRAQQEMAMASELQRILLPAKAAEAEYNVKKFTYDSKLLEKIYRTQSAALDNSYRGVTSAVGGNNSVTGNPQGNTYGPFGSKPVAPQPMQQTQTSKLGSGLTPR